MSNNEQVRSAVCRPRAAGVKSVTNIPASIRRVYSNYLHDQCN
jgi:hypothetical protein